MPGTLAISSDGAGSYFCACAILGSTPMTANARIHAAARTETCINHSRSGLEAAPRVSSPADRPASDSARLFTAAYVDQMWRGLGCAHEPRALGRSSAQP